MVLCLEHVEVFLHTNTHAHTHTHTCTHAHTDSNGDSLCNSCYHENEIVIVLETNVICILTNFYHLELNGNVCFYIHVNDVICMRMVKKLDVSIMMFY